MRRGRHQRSRLSLLREVRQKLAMEPDKVDFGRLFTTEDDPLPASEREVTEFIRRRTELWKATWVYPLLDELLRREETAQEARARRKKKS